MGLAHAHPNYVVVMCTSNRYVMVDFIGGLALQLCPEPVTFNKASYWPGSSKPEKELQLVPNTKFNKNPKGMGMV